MSGYRNRADAGRVLADAVASLLGDRPPSPRPLVLGIPRGGIVVAAPVAATLDAELGPITAIKVRAPANPELAIGAMASDGVPVLDATLIARLGLGADAVAGQVVAARREVDRRQEVFGAVPDAAGRFTVVVDDGVATGATLRAALAQVRRAGPQRLVCALPVGPPDVLDRIAREVDDLVCPLRPPWFGAVGEFYADFTQVSDAAVLALLAGV